MPESLLDDLNPAQLAAVTATEGCIRVVAGAGTGKTKTLTRRFLYLVEALGISPASILCVTFTNQAASEMKRRVRARLPGRDLGYICTFHSFCVTLLREDCHVISYPESFTVLDNLDREEIIRGIFEDMGITSKELTITAAMDYIAGHKSGNDYVPLMTAPDVRSILQAADGAETLNLKVFYRYLYECRKSFGLDFDDLLNTALYVLRTDAETRRKWQTRLEYVLIDEYQDIDKDEYALAELLTGLSRNLFVVGDPDQTIYTFRGADVRFMLRFEETHPGAETIFLTENYRSLPPILTAANTLIARNRDRVEKELSPYREGGRKPLYFRGRSREEEAEWVTGQIRELLDAGADPRDIAILYRANHQSRLPEESLIRAEIPYVLFNGTEFYHRKEIRDTISYLRMLDAGDDLSFLRTINEPRRGIGKKRIAFLREEAAASGKTLFDTLKQTVSSPLFHGTGAANYLALIADLREWKDKLTLTDLLARVLNESGYEAALRLSGAQSRLDNLAELRQAVYEAETTAGESYTLSDYLAAAALFTDMDHASRPAGIRMMTIHTAKGLEFDSVFLMGFTEGTFPSRKALTREALEEERRLCYVAFTRARDRLFLSDAAGPADGGSLSLPSRFLFDAGMENLEFTEPLDPSLILPAEPEQSSPDSGGILPPGTRVRHPILGDGTVLEWDAAKTAHRIRFDRLETPRSISLSMKLEIL